MADIKSAVKYSTEMQQLIATKLVDVAFCYRDWSGDELEGLRHYIRCHYRSVQLGVCAYCKCNVSLHSAANCHVEHIAPKSKYRMFMFEPKNLCVICADCNSIKREQEVHQQEPDTISGQKERKRYPRAGSAFLIVHPHFDTYDDHIEIFGQFYVDKSDKGHFTIGACKLNRKMRMFGWDAAYDADIAAECAEYMDAKTPNDRSKALRAIRKKLAVL
ncbi:HNH endonuclease [Tahibacter soli]|uniref:HNH endonuclease n=1 Tax=Tahibacter soli TaxID=2983605 RepID=A0A9X4BGK5_9GAMM|nr:HNH endonuclease [Tahibacter soli]MDC8012915.1 HNH endonuclease [Tahibacter soli]